MVIIKRAIEKSVLDKLFKGKVVIIYGARQVGKTTLIKEIQKKYPHSSIYLNCDEPDIRKLFTDTTSTEIKTFLGDKKLVLLDEAQRVKDIGLTLKLIADNFPTVQVIATGSSSFDLSNKVVEPLTGRKYEFHLFPLSLRELQQLYSKQEIQRVFEGRMILGMYPEIVQKSRGEAKNLLREITKSYLYKDILQYQDIRNPEVLEKLLQALALQIGNEVSYNELANLIGVDKKTVANYIQILEKAFVIFRLKPFSRNLRGELRKLRKIYFWDLGVRNALINNFNLLSLRQDKGALWENFLISERLKFNYNRGKDLQAYFWRTHKQQEIDYLEEAQGQLSGFEFKWGKSKFRPPKVFLAAYPHSTVELITKDKTGEFLGVR